MNICLSPLTYSLPLPYIEAVALLVDADEDSLKQAKFLVDACIAGTVHV